MPNQVLVPPLNFAIVAPKIYRSGYPNRKNHPFMKGLGLKSIIYLCPESYSEDNLSFVNNHCIKLYHLPMPGNKEPFSRMDHDGICEALEIMLDPSNHPILVHCNKGRHRVGCVMGILRKLQNWSLASIFDEYRRFAGDKIRIADQQLIELFDGPVEVEETVFERLSLLDK